MRIFMFASHYPVPYKPYYDNQFADLVARGHDLTIFSRGALDRDTVNEKVVRFELDERTRRFPAYLSNVPAALGSYLRGGLGRPLSSLRAARRMWSSRDGRALMARIRDLARMLAVNAGDPDVCFVHGLGTATRFRWLRQAFPEAATAMFYHGGEVPAVPDLPHDEAARTFEAFDLVFTNTRFSADHAESRGCDPEKLRLLPVGFDIDDFSPPPERDSSGDGPLRLLSAGRMSEEKGYIYALRALDRLVEQGRDDVVYSMTGEGYHRSELEDFVREQGLDDHVRFLGRLTTRGVMDAMREADVLLLPSVQVGNWVENQAAAVQEAMLHRCLAVTTRTGGVPESIPECMRPFSVPERDAEALAASIAEVYEMPPQEREDLADECRSFVVENYDIRELNERMLAEIAEVSESVPPRERLGPGDE